MDHARLEPTHQLLTLRQVAHRMNVSKRTVFRWIENGTSPALRVGAVIRIEPADLDRLIHEHQIPADGATSGVKS